MSIENNIKELKEQFSEDLLNVKNGNLEFEEFRVAYIGRKGNLANLFSKLGELSSNDRPRAGVLLNELKIEFSDKIDTLKLELSSNIDSVEIDIDLTLPGDPYLVGSIHPLTHILNEIEDIFKRIGFSIAFGSEIDSDYYNFEALNIAKHHPARDMQDTFYIDQDTLLRTHTSSTQIHFMEENDPPIRIIAPGRVYRNEDISVRSYCLFHQIEGLYVDKNVSFSDLKATLDYFAKELFGIDVKTRFRPSYFPFTEPSAEMDVSCIFCKGKGCNICKQAGWLEILGCGMVDPAVFNSVDINSEEWTGFAFGLGIERIAMLKYGVKDIRTFYDGDIRFLRQFK